MLKCLLHRSHSACGLGVVREVRIALTHGGENKVGELQSDCDKQVGSGRGAGGHSQIVVAHSICREIMDTAEDVFPDFGSIHKVAATNTSLADCAQCASTYVSLSMIPSRKSWTVLHGLCQYSVFTALRT